MIEVGVTQDIDACLSVRRAVFIVEQNVPEDIEMDGREHEGIHILLTVDGAPVGTTRIMIDGAKSKIGRVAVLAEFRGQGHGKRLMEESEKVLRARSDIQEIHLGAQTYVVPFYEALGYVVNGPEFFEADIPHRPMVMRL